MKKKVKNIGDMKINFIGTLEIPKKDKKFGRYASSIVRYSGNEKRRYKS